MSLGEAIVMAGGLRITIERGDEGQVLVQQILVTQDDAVNAPGIRELLHQRIDSMLAALQKPTST